MEFLKCFRLENHRVSCRHEHHYHLNILKVLATSYPSSPIVQIVLIVANAVRSGHVFVEAIDLVAKMMKLKKDESRER